MTLHTDWRYHFAGAAEDARAAWFAAFDAFTLPAGAGLLTPAQLVAAATARQALLDAAWEAWTGEPAGCMPVAAGPICEEAS